MINNELISVVVPVYNVEKYINKCVDSILNQSFDNFELILIDDGSTDSSGKICDNYKELYSNIKVIHKANGGLSDARNVGIENAVGKYITFIDSDDYIEKNYLRRLYDIIFTTNCDVVISCLNNFYECSDPLITFNDCTDFSSLSKDEAYRKMLLQDEIDVNATAKLFRTDIFKSDSIIEFPIGLPYEDIQIIDKIIEKAKLVVYTKYNGYFYLQRNGSIMYGSFNDKKMILVQKTKYLYDFISERYPSVRDAALKRYIYCNYHLLGRAILDNKYIDNCVILRNNILAYKKEILFNNIFSKKEKVATIFLLCGLKIYHLFWSFFCSLSGKKIGG